MSEGSGIGLTSILYLIILVQLVTLAAIPLYIAFSGLSFSEKALRGFFESLMLSLVTSFPATALVLAVSIPSGYVLSKMQGRTSRLLISLLILPSALSPAAVGLILLLFFATSPIGKLLDQLVNVVNNVPGVVIAQFFIGLPIGINYYMSIFRTVPKELEELALTMGYRSGEILMKILIPLRRNEVVAGGILVFTRVFGDFGASLILGGGIMGRTTTLPIFLNYVMQLGEMSLLSLLLAMYVVLAFLMILFLLRLQEGGERHA